MENAETWDDVINRIELGLDKYKDLLYRDFVLDDVIRLTELKIKRISKYDIERVNKGIELLKVDLEETLNNLNHIDEYSIRFFNQLVKKYG